MGGSAYRGTESPSSDRGSNFLFTCHSINKKNLSCFFKNRSIVLQPAVPSHRILHLAPAKSDTGVIEPFGNAG